MTYLEEVAKDNQYCFKRVYIKRRMSIPGGAYYETNWQDITEYVLDVSAITDNVDNVNLNEFTQGDFTLTLNNNTQKFSDETNVNSLFYGYLTRHKTMVTVYAGYIDIALGTEFGYYIGSGFMNGENINIDSDGTITMDVLAPTMILDEQSAAILNRGSYPGGTATATTAYRLIDGLATFDIGMVGLKLTRVSDNTTATVTDFVSATELVLDSDIMTAGDLYTFGQTRWWCNELVSAMVGRIYNLQRNAVSVFAPFLTGADITPANDISVDVNDFSSWSCRDALTKLAQISNSAYWISGDFRLKFLTKNPPGASVFTFNSQGANVNILAASNYNEGLNSLYSRVSYEDTNPQVFTDENFWEVGDITSNTWKYGQKEYTIDNRLLKLPTMQQTACDNTLSQHIIPKDEITLTTKFLPHIQLLDPVTVNYYGAPLKQSPFYWGKSYWGKGLWNPRLGGIQLKNVAMKVLKRSFNVMNFTSEFEVKRI